MSEDRKDQQEDKSNLPTFSGNQGEFMREDFLLLLKEYVAFDGSYEDGAGVFFNKIDDMLQRANASEIQDLYDAVWDLREQSPAERRIMIIHIRISLVKCRGKSWDEIEQDINITTILLYYLAMRDPIRLQQMQVSEISIIRTIPEVQFLIIECANFCLSHYARALAESLDWRTMNGIRYTLTSLLEKTGARKEVLAIYSKFLSMEIKSYSTDDVHTLSKKFRNMSDTYDRNQIIHLAHLKSNVLLLSEYSDATMEDPDDFKNKIDSVTADPFMDVLTNLLLLEEADELQYIQESLYQYMGEDDTYPINLSEYAGMLEFWCMKTFQSNNYSLPFLCRDLFEKFPSSESAATAFGCSLARRMHCQRSEESTDDREELIRLIFTYPQNIKLRRFLAVELAAIDTAVTLPDMLTRKCDIEAYAENIFDSNRNMHALYMTLLRRIAILQKTVKERLPKEQTGAEAKRATKDSA